MESGKDGNNTGTYPNNSYRPGGLSFNGGGVILTQELRDSEYGAGTAVSHKPV